MLLSSFPGNLCAKLGVKPNNFIIVINQPDNYFGLLNDLPVGVRFFQVEDNMMIDAIHIFVKSQQELIHELFASKPLLKEEGKLWIFYPKKASRIRTDLDNNFLIRFADDIHLFNIQLTDFDTMWTGMEFKVKKYGSS
jgi:hypothetical protein